MCPTVCPGTSIEGCGKASAKREFQGKAKPVMQRRRDLWPAKTCGFTAFLYAAGLVQSRAFHMQQQNWITGEAAEGAHKFGACRSFPCMHGSGWTACHTGGKAWGEMRKEG